MVDIFVSTTRPESVLDVFEVSLVKLLAFLGVIYFSDFKGLHHILWFVAVCLGADEWRQWHLKLRADGDKRSVRAVHVCYADRLEGVLILLA